MVRATEILAEEFGVERMGIVGGPKINTAFLEAGLLDEISLLVGAGIDGRGNMPAVFDGLTMEHDVTHVMYLLFYAKNKIQKCGHRMCIFSIFQDGIKVDVSEKNKYTISYRKKIQKIKG